RWTEHEENRLLDALVALNRAEDYDAFRAALARWHGPHMNFGYADVDGNIAYQATGKVPIRADGHQGLAPHPGSDSASRWQGFIPYDELPRAFNPPTGYVFTANHKVVDDSYPYYLAHEWSDPYRAFRIRDMLGDRRDLTTEDMRAMQLDTLSLHAEAMRPLLLRTPAGSELEQRALDLVEAWDLRNAIDSAGAAVYQAWYRFLVRATFGDELGDELLDEYEDYYWVHGPVLDSLVADASADGQAAFFDDVTTDAVETAEAISARALADAIDWLRDHHGADPDAWTWGSMHTTTFVHQPIGLSGIPIVDGLVNTEPVPTPGDRFTVNAAWFSVDRHDPFVTVGGVSQRMIVDLGDLDASLYVQSSGQSGHLFHPQRLDQIALWRDGDYEPMVFHRAAVDARTVATLRLVPGAAASDSSTASRTGSEP
ncbi:MAG: penicillin acylase family protein, partial [Acidobacteriota bacterium]